MSNWYITPSNDDILHYGVLGMKWGVRRYQNEDGSLTAAGQKRYEKQVNKINKRIDSRNKGIEKKLKKAEKGSLQNKIGKYIIKQNNNTRKEAIKYLTDTDIKTQNKDKYYDLFKDFAGIDTSSGSTISKIQSVLDIFKNQDVKSIDKSIVRRAKLYEKSIIKSNVKISEELLKMPTDKAYNILKNQIMRERASAAGYGAGFGAGYGAGSGA